MVFEKLKPEAFEPGDELDNWLAAEAEVKTALAKDSTLMIDTLTLPLRLTLEAARQGTLTLDQVRDTLETWPALLQDERCEQAEARFLMSLLTWEAGDSL